MEWEDDVCAVMCTSLVHVLNMAGRSDFWGEVQKLAGARVTYSSLIKIIERYLSLGRVPHK